MPAAPGWPRARRAGFAATWRLLPQHELAACLQMSNASKPRFHLFWFDVASFALGLEEYVPTLSAGVSPARRKHSNF